jgi:hypothetical protein
MEHKCISKVKREKNGEEYGESVHIIQDSMNGYVRMALRIMQ